MSLNDDHGYSRQRSVDIQTVASVIFAYSKYDTSRKCSSLHYNP